MTKTIERKKTITGIDCIRKAAADLGIPYERVDRFGTYIILTIKDKNYHFIGPFTPFNTSSMAKLCVDKGYSYRRLRSDIRTPRTMSFVDPKAPAVYQYYVRHKNLTEIKEEILENFKLPMILKMNSGRQGKNVFLIKKKGEIIPALKEIYNKESKMYDHIALAQRYIEFETEYRVLWYRGKVMLVYEKYAEDKSNNLSPLHNPDSTVINLDLNDPLVARIQKFLNKSSLLKEMEYCGADVIINKKGNMVLLEINDHPGFSLFIKHVGKKPIIEMYKKILRDI